MVDIDPERFEELVADALDDLPAPLAAAFDNVVVLVEDDPPEPGLLGLFEGVPLAERDSSYAGALPDVVRVFRRPLLEACDSEEEVVDEVWVTVVHELAHHMGIDDERLHALGWA